MFSKGNRNALLLFCEKKDVLEFFAEKIAIRLKLYYVIYMQFYPSRKHL